MAAPAAELRRADAAARRGGAGSTWLLDEVVFEVARDGATTTRHRSIIAIDTAAGAEEWRTFVASWSPWFEDVPAIDARILDRSDTFHRLDQRAVEIGQKSRWNAPGAGERRQVRAALPALAPGTIAEIVLTTREREPIFAAGSVHGHTIGKPSHRVARSRVVIDAPAGMRLAVEEDLRGQLTLRVETVAGRTRRIYEARAVEPMPEAYELPHDYSIQPRVFFSTGTSWARVAHEYGALVRRQIAAGPLPPDARVAPVAGRRATIDRAVDSARRSARWTGVALGGAETAPRTPAQVWRLGHGDSKDIAALLVALLGGAGIEAHVALVDAGPGRELSAQLPGLGEVDHAIVYVPREGLWIDPTYQLARTDQLPAHVQGRLALVAAPSTRGPVRIPAARARDNYIVEDRTITLVEGGGGGVTDVVRFGGTRETAVRQGIRAMGAAEIGGMLERYADDVHAARLVRHQVSRSDDLSTPFTIEITAWEAGAAYARAQDATVRIDLRRLFQVLPPDFIAADATTRALAQHPRVLEPHMVEMRYAIRLPDGFEPTSLPSYEHSFGPARYSVHFSRTGREVRGQVRFTLPRSRVAPVEARALARGVRSILDAAFLRLRFEHEVAGRLTRGDVSGALAFAKRLADRAPDDAGQQTRLSYVLSKAGLTAEAIEVGRQAAQLAPSAPWVQAQLSWAYRHDAVGRSDVAGFDRRAAIAAMEKAAALAPTIGFHHHKLGFLYSIGDDGAHLAGDLDRAALELGRARELGERGFDELLLEVLLRLGRTDELGKLVAAVDDPELSGAFRLAAASDDTALRRALDRIPAASRDDSVRRFVGACLSAGDYARLQRLTRLAGATLPLNKKQREALGRLRRVPVEPDTVDDLLARFMADIVLSDGKRWLGRDARGGRAIARLRWWAPDPQSMVLLRGPVRSPQLYADVLRAWMRVRALETAGPIERFEASEPTGAFSRTFYVTHEHEGKARILTVSVAPQFLGPAVLRAAAASRLDDASRMLDWALAESPAATSRNLWGIQLSRFWTRGQRGDQRRILLAAAGLLASTEPDRSLAVLTEECPRAAAFADACRMARAAALAAKGRYREAEEAVAGMQVVPDPEFVAATARDLLKRRAWPDLERLAAGTVPEDAWPSVQNSLAWSWVARGRPARARRLADSIRASKAGRSLWWQNEVAWLYLFTGGDIAPLVADLERAIGSSQRPGVGPLHTLAVCYARLGRHSEALATIRKAVDVRGRTDPIDQLVPGRIAASARLTAAARRAYQEVVSDPDSTGALSSSAGLARRWLKELSRE
jgi:tetratricopeptide (TPR) repeat protein